MSISIDDFAEDIKGPILPILDALGLIGGTGDDLDLGGWNFQKAIDFIIFQTFFVFEFRFEFKCHAILSLDLNFVVFRF